MDHFVAGLQTHRQEAEAALRSAEEAGDEFAAEVFRADLDDLRALALRHGVRLEP